VTGVDRLFNPWAVPVIAIFGDAVASGWLAGHGEIANAAIVLAIAGFLSLSIIRTRAIEAQEQAQTKVHQQNLMGVHPWHSAN
jgi:hypothetical protein